MPDGAHKSHVGGGRSMTKTILISFALVAVSAAAAAPHASRPQQQPPPPPPAARAAQPPPPAVRAAQPAAATRAQSAPANQRSQSTTAPQAAPCAAGSDCSETVKQIAREDQRREAQAREAQEQALRRAGSSASLCAQDACGACDGTCLRPAAQAACACSRMQ